MIERQEIRQMVADAESVRPVLKERVEAANLRFESVPGRHYQVRADVLAVSGLIKASVVRHNYHGISSLHVGERDSPADSWRRTTLNFSNGWYNTPDQLVMASVDNQPRQSMPVRSLEDIPEDSLDSLVNGISIIR